MRSRIILLAVVFAMGACKTSSKGTQQQKLISEEEYESMEMNTISSDEIPAIGHVSPPMPDPPTNTRDSIGVYFEEAEQMPEYPGGDKARQEFIAKNLIYPDTAIKMGAQGMIILQFIVETDGALSNIEVVKKFDDACAEEAVRVAKLMRWNPGKQSGKEVRVKIYMPVKFKLK